MPLTYTSQKCDCCGGSLEYDKDRRIFVCLYCGNEIVRQETYDGQFSIKWVARQALLSVASRDMKVAEEHIVECSKIDPHYVGTTIAQLAFAVVSLSLATSEDRRQSLTSQVQDHYRALRQTPLAPASDEEIFYEGLESSDAYGLLAIVYDVLGDEQRSKFTGDCVDASSVHSAAAAKDVVGYALSRDKFSLVDDLLRSTAEYDRDFVFAQLLARYPDSDGKTGNIELVVSGAISRDDAKLQLDEYLSSSVDGFATKLAVSRACLDAGIRPTTSVCLASLLPQCGNEDQATSVFEMVCSRKLNDEDTTGLIYQCASAGNASVGCLGLDIARASGQFVAVTQANVLTVLRRGDLSLDDKTSLLERLLQFDVSERFVQGVISVYVREDAQAPDRLDLLRYLVNKVRDLNPTLVEDYILHFSADGTHKSEVVGILLERNANAAVLKRALANYLATSPDPADVTMDVLRAFVSRGIAAGEDQIFSFVCRTDDCAQSVATIRSMKDSGWKPADNTLDSYLVSCSKGARFCPDLFSELLGENSAVSRDGLCAYALFCTEAAEEKRERINALARMLGSAPGSVRCWIKQAGARVDCTLAQGYLLASPDSEDVTGEILKVLVDGRTSLAEPISVTGASGAASSIKFKKYLVAHKADLSPAARGFAEEHKLFGGFF